MGGGKPAACSRRVSLATGCHIIGHREGKRSAGQPTERDGTRPDRDAGSVTYANLASGALRRRPWSQGPGASCGMRGKESAAITKLKRNGCEKDELPTEASRTDGALLAAQQRVAALYCADPSFFGARICRSCAALHRKGTAERYVMPVIATSRAIVTDGGPGDRWQMAGEWDWELGLRPRPFSG